MEEHTGIVPQSASFVELVGHSQVTTIGAHSRLVDRCSHVLLITAAASHISVISVDSWKGSYSVLSRVLIKACNKMRNVAESNGWKAFADPHLGAFVEYMSMRRESDKYQTRDQH